MEIDTGLNIIISASAKYRELNAVRYQADEKIITLEFALQGIVDLNKKKTYLRKMTECLNIFQEMSKKKSQLIDITLTDSTEITFLRVTRDIETVSEEEINLIVNLIRLQFSEVIIKDDNHLVGQESLKKSLKNKLIQRASCDSTGTMKFIVFREEGKIFVLNK